MPPPISEADLAGVWSLALVRLWAKKPTDLSAPDNSVGNIATAIANGWGEIRSAVGNRFDLVAFDALTPETTPSLVKGYAIDLSSEWLSRGNKREDAVLTAADKARAWLGLIVVGRDHTFDGILPALGSSTGSAAVRVGTSRLRFDPDNPCGEMRRRTRGI